MKRCFLCSKKINLTNEFECDCKHFFCSQHRYAETHQCKKMNDKKEREIEQLKNTLVKMDYDKISII